MCAIAVYNGAADGDKEEDKVFADVYQDTTIQKQTLTANKEKCQAALDGEDIISVGEQLFPLHSIRKIKRGSET